MHFTGKGAVELSIVECNQTVKGCSLHCHYLLYISGAERLIEREEEKKSWKTKQMI